MHIKILFKGHIVAITDQYLETLDQVRNWLKTNEIRSEIGWNDGCLTIKLMDLDSYALWLYTYTGPYQLIND